MVRKIRAKLILQLRSEGLSGRAIASSQGMSRKSITAVLEAADAADVSWDDVADRPDDEVYDLLFPGRGQHHSVFAQPDWEKVHRELARVLGHLEVAARRIHRQVCGHRRPGDGL